MKSVIKKPTAGVTVAALALQGLLLSGCMTAQEMRIGKNDGSDVCYGYRQKLDETRSFFAEDMVAGALAGILVGTVVALAAGGNARTTALAAAGGGVVGGVTGGFWRQLVDKQGESNAAATATQAAKKENDNLKKTQTALKDLVNCRRQEARGIQKDYMNKKISKAEAVEKKKIVLARLDEDYKIAEEINGNIKNRSGEFQFALQSAGKKNGDLKQQTSTNALVTQGITNDTKALADVKNELGGIDSSALDGDRAHG